MPLAKSGQSKARPHPPFPGIAEITQLMAAQAPSEPTAEAAIPASPAPSAPATGEGHWVVERPEPGLARGEYPWPAWAIGLLGGLVVSLGLAYLIIKVRGRLKR